MNALVLLLALALAACTVVSVHGDKNARVVPVLGSARIEASPGRAIAIDAWGAGITEQCGAVAIGVASSHCAAVDPRGCPIAIIKSTGPIDEGLWGNLAPGTRVDCATQAH